MVTPPVPLLRSAAAALALAALAGAGQPQAQPASTIGLVDRYAAGDFDGVLAALHQVADFERVLRDVRGRAPEWMLAGGPEDRARRELAAATFALEAARVSQWRDWKWVVTPPPMKAEPPFSRREEIFRPLNTLYWRAAPLLIEWGCALLRQAEEPRPVERWWQLAALAVAQRSEDPHFLVGDPAVGLGRTAGEVINAQHEIRHLDHVQSRFPDEARFALAQGIARARIWPDEALQAFAALRDHPDVGGEAVMRLGKMTVDGDRRRDAFAHFDHAERQTRDSWVLYLTRYLRGLLHLREQQAAQAETAFRAALLAQPRAQSATLALATVLTRRDRRDEAERLVSDMLAASPPMPDPWRGFEHADDRFWPELVARLRKEIHP
jgi:tetratricopeptide (TPR) repeat protein